MRLGNYKGNDVELCRTTNGRVSEKAIRLLIEACIPFTKNIKYIPFFRREEYNGASRVWIITTSPRRYGQARRILDQLDNVYKDRLLVSNF
ncbi:MAG: hypothetical protein U0K68_11035 [Agathobacter sp.]|nr:hypothetical protein [Agathobacter sp.]